MREHSGPRLRCHPSPLTRPHCGLHLYRAYAGHTPYLVEASLPQMLPQPLGWLRSLLGALLAPVWLFPNLGVLQVKLEAGGQGDTPEKPLQTGRWPSPEARELTRLFFSSQETSRCSCPPARTLRVCTEARTGFSPSLLFRWSEPHAALSGWPP